MQEKMRPTVSQLISFHEAGPKAKLTQLYKIQNPVPIDTSNGFNLPYSRAISALKESFFRQSNLPINSKIDYLKEYIKSKSNKKHVDAKICVEILKKHTERDLLKFRPPHRITRIRPSSASTDVVICGVTLNFKPQVLFSWSENDRPCIGGIWLFGKKHSGSSHNLQAYVDALYLYLATNYANTHLVVPEKCIAYNIYSKEHLSFKEYSQIEYSLQLEEIVEELINLSKAKEMRRTINQLTKPAARIDKSKRGLQRLR